MRGCEASVRRGPGVAGSRLVPLSGVAAAVLIAVALAVSGNTPPAGAPVATLVGFYRSHGTDQLAAGALLSLGALAFLAFAASVASHVRLDGDAASHTPSILCLAGGGVLVVGLTILAGLMLALGDVAGRLDPRALQAIHVLSQEMVFTLTVGTSAFLLGAGAASMQTGTFPWWLTWLAIVLGAVGAVPSHVLGGVLDHVGFGAFAGLCLWTVLVGALLAMRPGAEAHTLSRSPARKEAIDANL